MAERTQRYSEAERAGQAANRREAAKRAKYGTSYEQQGYRPAKEQGQAFLKRQELKARYGAFANPTWQYEDRGGQLYRKPLPGQEGRIAEQGGTAQWEPVPDYVQRSYANPRRRAFFEQNPDLASRPGGGQDAWLYQRFVGGLQRDPVTGLPMNRQGELYQPGFREAWAQGGAGGQYVGPRPDLAPPGGPPGTPPGWPAPPGIGGPFMAPPSYTPPYSAPFGETMGPRYQYPGAPGTLGTLGSSPMTPSPMQPPGVAAPRYRPTSTSSFSSYRPPYGQPPSPWGMPPRR